MIFGVGRIIAVVDSNEANTEHRENLLNILAGFDIITTKTGKVFDNDAVHTLFTHGGHHLFKPRSVEVRSGITVVTKLCDKFNVGLFPQIAVNEVTLGRNAVALAFIGNRNVAIFL